MTNFISTTSALTIHNQAVSINDADPEISKEINEEYKKLNEKCDKIINRIKNRKEKNRQNG